MTLQGAQRKPPGAPEPASGARVDRHLDALDKVELPLGKHRVGPKDCRMGERVS